MKKTIVALALTMVVGLAFMPIEGKAQMGPGYGMGQGGAYGIGPGMMGREWGPGYGMGPSMMGQGWGHGMGHGMMHRGMGHGFGYEPQYQQPQYPRLQKPLEEKDARAILEDYLGSTRNPNLKLGKIEDHGNIFEAEILTKDDSLVDKIVVDKRTGRTRSIY